MSKKDKGKKGDVKSKKSIPPVVIEKEGHPRLADILKTHDVVSVEDDYIITVAKSPDSISLSDGPFVNKQLADASTPQMSELGSSSSGAFTSFSRLEYNSELRGLLGLEKYDRMRKSDGIIRGMLRLVKTPVLAGRWFVKAASQDQSDVDIAEFVEDCLWEYLGTSWPQFLTEALMMCEFGYYMFEKVWEYRMVDGVQRLTLAKLAPRHPMDVKKWYFDSHGGPNGVEFFPFDIYDMSAPVYIPIEKLLVFTFDQEAGNIEGISILRSAYKHWYYKEQLYKIDAIQKERHGVGIPVIQLPLGYSPADKAAANELGRNLRSNERAHVVLPPNWLLTFAKLEGHVVNALDSIDTHNEALRESILGSFIAPKGKVTADEDHILFMKSTRFIADIICSTINQYLIPDLVKMNFGQDVELPELNVRRIGEQADWRTLSFAIRNFVGSGLITPDQDLEDQIREELDLTPFDPATARPLATPHGQAEQDAENAQEDGAGDESEPIPSKPAQPHVGGPRQTPAARRTGNGKSNSGKDSSGGK